jgi:prepilin-type N-terminal cleavage/methylation domain-containing protein
MLQKWALMRISEERAFTLVELMIVVAIIGLLAVLAIPSFARARENSQNSRYAADLRVATGAFQEYAIENGAYPADVNQGIIPAGMAQYLVKIRWTKRNSLGGLWDWDAQVFGVQAGVSVYQPRARAEQLTRLDRMIDDGNLGTGTFRQRSAGYISVIE